MNTNQRGKAHKVHPNIESLLKEATPMGKDAETVSKIHVVKPDICTNIETVINSIEAEFQGIADTMCKSCTRCGDLPGAIGRPKGKPKPVKREKTEEEKKQDFAKYWVKTSN